MRALRYEHGAIRVDPAYPEPSLEAGEALIRVLLAGICNTDLEMLKGYRPFQGVLGHEFVGIVEHVAGTDDSTGSQARIGKRVVGEINVSCNDPSCDYCRQGLSLHCPRRTAIGISSRDGAFADYLALPVRNLHTVPDSVPNEEAVFVEPLAAAFSVLDRGKPAPSDFVIVLGDGKLGQLMAQVLKLTCCNLLVLGKHQWKLRLLAGRGIRALPLDDGLKDLTSDSSRADVVVDCTGVPSGLETALQLVKPRGKVVAKTTLAAESTLSVSDLVVNEVQLIGSRCGPFEPALRALEEHLVDVKPLISAVVDLEAAADAMELASRRDTMKVLIAT